MNNLNIMFRGSAKQNFWAEDIVNRYFDKTRAKDRVLRRKFKAKKNPHWWICNRDKIERHIYNAITPIGKRIIDHQKRYPAFDVNRFNKWYQNHSDGWKRWAKGQDIKNLNKTRRKEKSIEKLAEKD